MSKIVCPKCGNLVESSELFCPYCGEKLAEIPQGQPAAGPAQWPQQPQAQQPRPQAQQQPRPRAPQQPYRQPEKQPKPCIWVLFLRIYAWVFGGLILAAGIVGAIFFYKKGFAIWLILACPVGALLLAVAFVSCAMVLLHIADETRLIRKQLHGSRK